MRVPQVVVPDVRAISPNRQRLPPGKPRAPPLACGTGGDHTPGRDHGTGFVFRLSPLLADPPGIADRQFSVHISHLSLLIHG